MNREQSYFAVIGGGLLLIVAFALWQLWPERSEPLPPPAVLTQQLNTEAPVEKKVKAARDFIRHGPAARAELERYEAHEPEVVDPLLQATMKNRDYRSLPTLFELLEHEDAIVRGRAGAAIQKILGANFGFRANAPPEERTRVIEVMKQDYQNAQGYLPEFYKDQSR